MTAVALDVTRTLSRAGLPAPTGIDRVERAWIDGLLAGRFGPAFFVTTEGALDAEAMAALLPAIDGRAPPPPADLRARLARGPALPARLRAAFRRSRLRLPAGHVALVLGHSALTPDGIAARRRAGAARVAAMIHDLIPLEHPEFAREGGAARMAERLRAAEAADALLYNSADTRARAEARMRRPPAGFVAPLGVPPERVAAPFHGGFVALGTIEPRKNHALLLDLWEGFGPEAPPLRIVGRRGWRNAALFARLDARPPGVIEDGPLPDAAARALLAGARALLFPSFAEGYGLPVAEALALGAPVVASDLPAHRAVAQGAARLLPPGDAAAWRAAILDLSSAPGLEAARAAFAGWRAPTWEEHFRAALPALRA